MRLHYSTILLETLKNPEYYNLWVVCYVVPKYAVL